MKTTTLLMCCFILSSRLHAGIVTLTESAAATCSAIQYSTVTQSNSTHIVIQTNVTAEILHLSNNNMTSFGSGVGYLTIQINGLNFQYGPSSVTEDNRPYIIGPATITLTAQESITSQGNVESGQVNSICTILTNQVVQCTTVISNYVPADAIVIPASATGNVQIILESSPDLVNWTAAEPGTYGASAGTNRFFRVRAVCN